MRRSWRAPTGQQACFRRCRSAQAVVGMSTAAPRRADGALSVPLVDGVVRSVRTALSVRDSLCRVINPRRRPPRRARAAHRRPRAWGATDARVVVARASMAGREPFDGARLRHMGVAESPNQHHVLSACVLTGTNLSSQDGNGSCDSRHLLCSHPGLISPRHRAGKSWGHPSAAGCLVR